MTVANINISNVTPEQIGMAHKVWGSDGKPFYLVENSKGEVDEQGHIIEYTVKAIFKGGRWHLTCNCKAGQRGVTCWHKKAAVACSAEEKTAMDEQVALNEAAKQRAKLQICGRPATQEEWDRVMNAKPVIDRKAKAPQPKPFSLLK
jgi:hypothetical protein